MNAVIKLNPLLLHLAIPVFFGTLSSYLSGDVGKIYRSLNLPPLAPPALVFAVVWAVLYLLMGTASYLIFTARGLKREERGSCFGLYGLMLLMNCLWNFLFFRFRLFLFSAIWIVLLFAVTMLCAALFYRIRKAAGGLLLPAGLWLIFTGILSFSVASMN